MTHFMSIPEPNLFMMDEKDAAVREKIYFS